MYIRGKEKSNEVYFCLFLNIQINKKERKIKNNSIRNGLSLSHKKNNKYKQRDKREKKKIYFLCAYKYYIYVYVIYIIIKLKIKLFLIKCQRSSL